MRIRARDSPSWWPVKLNINITIQSRDADMWHPVLLMQQNNKEAGTAAISALT